MTPRALDWRRVALTLVVLGAMSVSIGGQVKAIEPQIGQIPAVVFALTNDAGSILALNIALSAAAGSSVRKWAWVAILIAAGAGAALNSWHVVNGDSTAPLPVLLAVAAGGVEPILLVLVLSHLIGLVMSDRHHQDDTSTGHQKATSSPDTSATSTGTSGHQDAPGAHQETLVLLGTSSPDGGHQALIAAPPAAPVEAEKPRPRVAVAAAKPRSAGVSTRALEAVPLPRPDWVTDTLLDAVLADMRTARADGERYGRPRLMERHGLNDPKAKQLLAHIRDHRLVERAS